MALVLLEMLEEEAENRRGNLPLRVFRDRSNPLEDLSDESFKYRYRVNKEIANDLCALLHDDLQRSTRRSRSLPVTLQILVTLKYFATGTFQQGNADLHGLHRTTVSRTIHRVAAAMCRHRHEYIKFPQTQMELQQVKEGFYDMSDFPNVLGAVDGSLIPIFAPKKDEHLFVCRKGYHALNIQGICKANMAFTNILAKYPGSTHDAYIWSSSEISFMFETGQIEDGWLLGDSGYPLQPWLLTPLLNPHGRGEEVYNRRHKTARCVIERAFGLLKMRFRCLHDTGRSTYIIIIFIIIIIIIIIIIQKLNL